MIHSNTSLALSFWVGLAVVASHAGFVCGQEAGGATRRGYLIDVPVPLEGAAANRLIDQLARLGEAAPTGERVTAVLRYPADIDPDAGQETAFEDSLKLARAITQPELRRVRVVSWVEGRVAGHSVLPIMASDLLLVSGGGEIANATAGETSADETILLTYQSIAARRSLFPEAIVKALVDPGLELARVSKVDGEQVFAAGESLEQLRQSGEVLDEDIWSAAGAALQLDATQLRSARIAAATVDSREQAAELLDLAELSAVGEDLAVGEATGAYLEISGAIVDSRVRRWQSNLQATLESGEINTWVISIDSAGGSLDDSAALAGWFAGPQPPLRRVAGWVRGEARGDAALVAVACKPLYLQPDARLGGPGSEEMGPADVLRLKELIEEIAEQTRRPAALIAGLLDPELVVYRYTNRRTGRVLYSTEADLVVDADDPEVERDRWVRGEQIDLSAGLTANEAIALGLAEDRARSLEEASTRVGLSGTPPPVTDRGLIRFIEKIGRSNTLAFLLLFIGFMALSAEANAPGLSVPGFVALVCFALYFWMKFLAGTAEWLELIAFSLGLICIAIEIFVVPGFGIFGIGGLALTVLGIVLMSQTFVIPRNVYQVEVLSRGVWLALGGAAGMVGGFVAMRMMLPHVPLLRGLVMEESDDTVISESERLADYGYLLGKTGVATTPLRPSGKARFDDQVVQVISDGTMVAQGDPVRVCEVHGPKVVVEAMEG